MMHPMLDSGPRRALVLGDSRRLALELDEQILVLADSRKAPKGAVKRAVGSR